MFVDSPITSALRTLARRGLFIILHGSVETIAAASAFVFFVVQITMAAVTSYRDLTKVFVGFFQPLRGGIDLRRGICVTSTPRLAATFAAAIATLLARLSRA